MAIILQEALERLVSIEKEALAALSPAVTADAKPYMMHTQEAFPYLTNRVGNVGVEYDSHDIDVYEVELVARLVIGHITEGYQGETEGRLYAYLPALIEAINARELLQSVTFPVALNGLMEARVSSSTGLRIFETAGIQARQVGTEITVLCIFNDDLTQLYL